MDIQIRRFLKYLSLERRYSENTITSYQIDLTQFEGYLTTIDSSAKVHWNLISKNTLRGFMAYLQQEGISQRSIARKIATLKSFFKYLSREEVISQNPASGIKMPKFDKKLPEFIGASEMDRILSPSQQDNFENVRDIAIIELFYGTGIRLSELINIKIHDVYFDEDLIRVIGKGNKERIVPIGKEARNILKKYLEYRTHFIPEKADNLFVLKNGKAMYPVAVQRIVHKYLSMATSTHKNNPHILRHTFATHLLNRGASIRVVKDLLGHENLSTTQVYTHLSVDHLKKIYNQAHPGVSNKSKPKPRRSE